MRREISSHLISSHLMWCDVRMNCYILVFDIKYEEGDLISSHLISSHVMWCDVMWCDVMWCDVMWCDVRMNCYISVFDIKYEEIEFNSYNEILYNIVYNFILCHAISHDLSLWIFTLFFNTWNLCHDISLQMSVNLAVPFFRCAIILSYFYFNSINFMVYCFYYVPFFRVRCLLLWNRGSIK